MRLAGPKRYLCSLTSEPSYSSIMWNDRPDSAPVTSFSTSSRSCVYMVGSPSQRAATLDGRTASFNRCNHDPSLAPSQNCTAVSVGHTTAIHKLACLKYSRNVNNLKLQLSYRNFRQTFPNSFLAIDFSASAVLLTLLVLVALSTTLERFL